MSDSPIVYHSVQHFIALLMCFSKLRCQDRFSYSDIFSGSGATFGRGVCECVPSFRPPPRQRAFTLLRGFSVCVTALGSLACPRRQEWKETFFAVDHGVPFLAVCCWAFSAALCSRNED